jgi:hypothetical protein
MKKLSIASSRQTLMGTVAECTLAGAASSAEKLTGLARGPSVSILVSWLDRKNEVDLIVFFLHQLSLDFGKSAT